MIRPLTFICLLAAFGSGLYLYSEKHKASLLDREIGRTIHGTEAARARTSMLKEEWAMLNDPARLQDMSDKYLSLKPMAPAQFVQLADLSNHLPAPAPVIPGGGTDDTSADDSAAAQDAPAVADQATPETPVPDMPVPDMPALVAKAEPAHAAPPHAVMKVASRAAKKSARPTALVDREPAYRDGPLAHGTPLPLAGMPQARARVMSAMARPMRLAAARPAVMTAYPTALASAPYIGSALAGGASLPPPVPLR
jgi:hypothetical protein